MISIYDSEWLTQQAKIEREKYQQWLLEHQQEKLAWLEEKRRQVEQRERAGLACEDCNNHICTCEE